MFRQVKSQLLQTQAKTQNAAKLLKTLFILFYFFLILTFLYTLGSTELQNAWSASWHFLLSNPLLIYKYLI